MSGCEHKELLKIYEIINNAKRIKEFVCEDCYEILSSCSVDEEIPKTQIHTESCNFCSTKKKKKFRVIKEAWQEQLIEFEQKSNKNEEKKKRARI